LIVSGDLEREGFALFELRSAIEADAEIEVMTEELFTMANGGHIDVHLFQVPLVTEIGERPEVSRLARKQSQLGSMLTTLRHEVVALEDAVMLRFVRLVDGIRTVDQLVDELQQLATEMQAIPEGQTVTRDIVEHNLKPLARLGLLVR